MVGGRLARDSCVWSREENERSHRTDTKTWVESVRFTRDSRWHLLCHSRLLRKPMIHGEAQDWAQTSQQGWDCCPLAERASLGLLTAGLTKASTLKSPTLTSTFPDTLRRPPSPFSHGEDVGQLRVSAGIGGT